MFSSAVIATIDRDGDGAFSEAEKRAYAQRLLADLSITVDGSSVSPQLVSWTIPQPARLRDGLGEIHIEYTVSLPDGAAAQSLLLANHHLAPASDYLVNVTVPQDQTLRILAQKRNTTQSLYVLDFERTSPRIATSRTPFNSLFGLAGTGRTSSIDNLRIRFDGIPFANLFHIGMRHIAEGTDHLLLLLTLLLPAPLLLRRSPRGSHWGPPASVRESLLRILRIVTAFTVGHSVTRTLAALGVIHTPKRSIEVLIAVSILVSAVHALRPILAGKEAWLAGLFGLVHGLAFAATLDRLGLGHWDRLAGIVSFNLGIEALQMLVVAAILPSLILLSRTRVYDLHASVAPASPSQPPSAGSSKGYSTSPPMWTRQ